MLVTGIIGQIISFVSYWDTLGRKLAVSYWDNWGRGIAVLVTGIIGTDN